MTELEVLVGNLNRLTKLLRLAWSDVANPLLATFERRERSPIDPAKKAKGK